MSYLNEAVDNILLNADDPEQEAIDLVAHLRVKFGWAGTLLTRQDVGTELGRPLTDDEWQRVTSHKVWENMGGVWLEGGGWEDVRFALDDVGITGPDWDDDDDESPSDDLKRRLVREHDATDSIEMCGEHEDIHLVLAAYVGDDSDVDREHELLNHWRADVEDPS